MSTLQELPSVDWEPRPRVRPAQAVALIGGAIGFAGVYFASGSVTSLFADGAAPQPNVPGTVTRDWYLANPQAPVVQASMMLLSVLALAVFVIALADVTRGLGTRVRSIALVAGGASVVAMAASSSLTWALSALVAEADPGRVELLRTAGFLAGGTIHVALLGGFVLAASRLPGMTRPLRVLAIVVAVIAIGSLLSIGIYYASVAILLGRLLAMVWCVLAAISLVRRLRA